MLRLILSVAVFILTQRKEKNIEYNAFFGGNEYKNRMFGLIYISSSHAAGDIPVIFLKTI